MEVKKKVENLPQLGDSWKNKSIPELISTLRTAFRTEDFDRVEAILVGKEAEMKREIEKKKEEIDLLKKERDFHKVEKVKFETQFKAVNERAEKAKEKYKKLLEENKKGVKDYTTTIAELRKKNTELGSAKNLAEEERDFHSIEKLKFETQFKDVNEREKKAKERYEKLLEEVKKGVADYTTNMDELRKKISELESEKSWAEEELDRWMSRYEERVSRLEEEVNMLNGTTAVEDLGPMEVVEGNGRDDNGENGNGESVRVPLEENVASNWNENATIEPNAVSPPHLLIAGSGKFAPEDPILIVVSDDDCICTPVNKKETSQNLVDVEDVKNRPRMLKRKRASSIDLCKSESNENHEENTILAIQMKQHQELSLDEANHCSEKGIPSVANDVEELHTPLSQDQVVLRGFEEKIAAVQAFPTFLNKFSGGRIDELVDIEECSSSSESEDTDSSSDVDTDINGLLSKYQKNGENRRWASEADMTAAFEKDPELCLNAVCALYRQHMSVRKSLEVSPLSSNRGFNKLDAPKGIGLAKFLINEDPQGKLKRSVKELELRNSKGLSECRRLAVEHSRQLFKIYQDKEDPFFVPPYMGLTTFGAGQ